MDEVWDTINPLSYHSLDTINSYLESIRSHRLSYYLLARSVFVSLDTITINPIYD